MQRAIRFDGQFYVYIHCNEIGVPFYAGKGKGDRGWNHKQRGKIWKDYVKKHPFCPEKTHIYLVDSEQQAFSLEKELIWLLRKELGLWLANATDGGEGMSGYNAPKSEEHKKKISLSQKGKPRNPVSIKKMAKTRKKQCALMSQEDKDKHYSAVSKSLEIYWKNVPENLSKLRDEKISRSLKSRTSEQKAFAGAKGWETRRRNQQKEP
jgi:hypothetical protein